MTRNASWNGLGTDVKEAKSMNDVIELAGLNYTVEKVALQTINNQGIPGYMATMAGDRFYGIVSDSYGIVQNSEAFDFVDSMSSDLVYEKAGETASGMVYIIAKLPDVSICGDSFTPHVIFRNGFNGKFSVAVAICPLRIVCQNQFSIAFKESDNTVSIRHTINAKDRLEEAQHILKAVSDHMSHLNMLAETMARKSVNVNQLDRIVRDLFPIKQGASARVAGMAEKNREAFMAEYNIADNANFTGTAWGVINAYAGYITHTDPRGHKAERFENKFIKTTFDKPMNHILDVIERNTSLLLAA